MVKPCDQRRLIGWTLTDFSTKLNPYIVPSMADVKNLRASIMPYDSRTVLGVGTMRSLSNST
jgi:hypothetical protein